MKKFFFGFYGGVAKPEEREESVKKWNDWMEDLVKKEVLIEGAPFMASGYEVAGDMTVEEFITFDERINGYVIVTAKDMDAALKILQTCPHFEYEGRAELHELMETEL